MTRSRSTIRLPLSMGFAALLLCGCGPDAIGGVQVHGSGVVKTESREVAGFSEVRLAGGGGVEIVQGGGESLTVEAEENILPLLESRVDRGRLLLGVKPGASIRTNRPVVYRVTVKELSGIGVSGSGNVKAREVDTSSLGVSISGSGDVAASGKAGELTVDVSGSGSFDGGELRSQAARASIAGSGGATVNASERLVANVRGSGSVRYLGDPAVVKTVSGSGSVTRKGP